MKKQKLMAGLCISAIIGASGWVSAEPMDQAVHNELKGPSTADHKKFKALQEDFQTGPEVTRACLTCHTEAATQMHKSIHWTWEWDKAGGMGKKNSINNF